MFSTHMAPICFTTINALMELLNIFADFAIFYVCMLIYFPTWQFFTCHGHIFHMSHISIHAIDEIVDKMFSTNRT